MAQTKQRGTLSAPVGNAMSLLSARGLSVFAVRDFADALGWNRLRAAKMLHQLLRAGWVIRLTKGKYLTVPLEAGPEAIWTEGALVIAGHLAKPSAVAYWSACHYWNWTEQVPRTVFIQTTQHTWKTRRKVLGVTYEFVRLTARKCFGTVERPTGRGRIVVTDREKTLVDALDRPDLCGGMRQVVEMLPEAAQAVRWEKVEAYLEKMGSGALYKRLGFLVERLGKKVNVPDGTRRLEAWRERLTGGYAPLEPRGPATGPVNNRWRVRLNVSALAEEAAEG